MPRRQAAAEARGVPGRTGARPAISALLPYRDAAATLDAAIASIAAQTFPDWELLLWDDGSTDRSRDIADAWSRRDRRIASLGGGPEGIVRALTACAGAARGPILARMDADDAAAPERFAVQHARLLAADQPGLVGSRVRIEGPAARSGQRRYEAWINGLVEPAAIRNEIFIECPAPHPTFFLWRTVYDAAGGYRAFDGPEDYDLVFRIAQSGRAIAKCPETLLTWRDFPGRLSRNDPRYAPARFRALKRQYLAAWFGAAGRPWYQWGAGAAGKPWLREWTSPRPAAVADINARKVGGVIHGYPVIPPEALPGPGAGFIVVAVGAPGARDQIRNWLIPRGHREFRDFVFVA